MGLPDINNRYLVDTKTGAIRFTSRGMAAWRGRFQASGINIQSIKTVAQLLTALKKATVLPCARFNPAQKIALKQAMTGKTTLESEKAAE